MAVSLHHVNIRALDLEQTIAFYVDAIGLAKGFDPRSVSRGLALRRREARNLHLTVGTSAPIAREAGVDHFAFVCDDLDATLKRLDRLGLPYSPPRRQSATGIRQAFLLDPNGITVELQGP